jgi:hypothetical protein
MTVFSEALPRYPGRKEAGHPAGHACKDPLFHPTPAFTVETSFSMMVSFHQPAVIDRLYSGSVFQIPGIGNQGAKKRGL